MVDLRWCFVSLFIAGRMMLVSGQNEESGSEEFVWQPTLPGSMIIGLLRLTGVNSTAADIKTLSVITSIISRYTVVSVMDIPEGFAEKLLLAVNGAGGFTFQSRLVNPPEKSPFKQNLGLFYRPRYVDFLDAKFFQDPEGNLRAPVLISVFTLKRGQLKSPKIAYVSTTADERITSAQLIRVTSHAKTMGEDILIGGDFQTDNLPPSNNETSRSEFPWWNGEEYRRILTPQDCPGCIWSCTSCKTLGYPMEGVAGDLTETMNCPYCRNFTWLIRPQNPKQASVSNCPECKMLITGNWLRPRISPGASRVWRYENDIPVRKMGVSLGIKHPVELMVAMAASEDSPPENLIENPEYDRDPASRLENKKNMLLGFFGFANPDDSVPISSAVKQLLKKILERNDLMMVSNMPKSLHIIAPDIAGIQEKRAGGNNVTAAVFYDEKKISLELIQEVKDTEFKECPPAVALIKYLEHADQPPIGLLILYNTRTLLKATALTKLYSKAQEILKVENIVIAGDFNIEHPPVPKIFPLSIPWYDGHSMTYLSTPEDCFCPWVCPCVRFKYLISVPGGGEALSKPPYTKDFMWLQKPTEVSGVGGGGLCNVPFGKMIIGGKWLQQVVYPGTARVHVLDVSYRLPPGDPTALQIEYPIEVVLHALGGPGPGTTPAGPGTTPAGPGTPPPGPATTEPPGGTNNTATEFNVHIAAALGGTMCKKFKAMEMGPIKERDPDIPISECWYQRTCLQASPNNCTNFSQHKCK